ncbi:MAG: ATP-binding protein [Treponema sp.]|nr:ATP-binding protein [Treponema sp.]
MIQMLFFLRFRAQLRRVRPDLIALLEETIVRAIEGAGGKTDQRHWIIIGSFDEHALGIWLTIITVIESIRALLAGAATELYGFSLVICRDVEDYEMGRLCSALAARPGGTNVWFAPIVQEPLSAYARMDERIVDLKTPPPSLGGFDYLEGMVSLIDGYAQLVSIETTLEKAGAFDPFPFREKIGRVIMGGSRRNVLLTGPMFIGKRDGLYHFCADIMRKLPPLVLRFAERSGIGCFADMLSPTIRAFVNEYIRSEMLDELDTLAALLFRERLLEEYSDHLTQKARTFFQKVLAVYIAVMKNHKYPAILIIENIHQADDTASQIVIDVFISLPDRVELQVYGTCATDAAGVDQRIRRWETVFPRVIKFASEDFNALNKPELTHDLWEVAYAVSIMRPYFPGILFPQLFEEEERNSGMIHRAFKMLMTLGVIDALEDPYPRIPDFAVRAGQFLGERILWIRRLVINRLLAWTHSGKFRACFSLLEALSKLGGTADDRLILNAIYGDVINGTFKRLDEAIAEKHFYTVVGEERGPAILFIFNTLKALIHDDEDAIRKAFTEAVPTGNFFPGYRIQILVNLASYNLGIKNIDVASSMIKEAMMISQSRKIGGAPVYRLFSIVNLAERHVDESLDYIAFAIDNAEKVGQLDELCMSAYYAAIAQFLFGNLSRAEHFSQRAEQTAVSAGLPAWVDRARFLRGKLRFEIGAYDEALDIFKSIQENPAGPTCEEMEHTVSAWIYRAAVFAKAPWPQKPAPYGDALLFELEAAYIYGDYQKTVELARILETNIPKNAFLFTERPDWHSGFAQCELLLLPEWELYDRLSFVYRALAQCRLATSDEERAGLIQRMQRFTRDELLPDMDMNDIFYFYAYYRMLQESGASVLDLGTAASIANQRLQRRASRIDLFETKRMYLDAHYWNSALSAVAREHKLI